MNILQIIPVFNPLELYGRSQQIVYQISKEAVKSGHKVLIYRSDAKRSNLGERIRRATEEINGIKVYRFKSVSSLLSQKMRFMITPVMRKSLDRQAKYFDLIHLHEARSYQHILTWQVAEKKMLYVVQAHACLRERKGLPRKIYDLFYSSKIFKDASRVIAISQVEAKQYRSIFVLEKKIAIIPNEIDLSE